MIFHFKYEGGQLSVKFAKGRWVVAGGKGKLAPSWVWAAAESLTT